MDDYNNKFQLIYRKLMLISVSCRLSRMFTFYLKAHLTACEYTYDAFYQGSGFFFAYYRFLSLSSSHRSAASEIYAFLGDRRCE
jgi:hypothetical protein